MSDCLFCRLVANEIPSYTVYEDEKTRAFLDIFPSTDGHTVVVLKKHGETILDYDHRDLTSLWSTVQKVVGAIQDAFDTKILAIGINHGEPKGVHHLHVHVIPRESDDGGIIQSLVHKKQKEDLAEVSKKIAMFIS